MPLYRSMAEKRANPTSLTCGCVPGQAWCEDAAALLDPTREDGEAVQAALRAHYKLDTPNPVSA